MLIDSHCHLDQLDLTPYQGNLDLALQAANAKGVNGFLCVCIDLEHFPSMLHTIEQCKHKIWASVGLHPTSEVELEPTVAELTQLASNPNIIAIGETGLDYYHCTGDIKWQQDRFRNHIRVAKALNKPLIVHSRMAPEDTIRILKEEQAETVGGILHCFTESWEMAEQAIDMGFYISFSGIITFANAKALQAVATRTPLTSILIETDSPYLAPVPFRGKSNEPAYVRYVAEKLAELKNVPFEMIATQTTQNFYRLFNIV